ncbi:MAG: phospholipid carrier-dependent glycosyltransferase [Proteobacteria bacterium]|nr:phospholipid carrier-dependent glycosyltransferase [Pseudomonadota bacterium]
MGGWPVRPRPWARWALLGLIVAACVLAAGCWRVYCNTWDEPEHLAAGLELLDRNMYEYDTEHPPLARLFLAVGPWLAGAHSYGTPPPNGTQEGLDILYGSGKYQHFLTLARAGALPFLALLLWATWLWGRRLLRSEAAALLAVLLLVSAPAVLGHAALASLDVPAAATMLLAFYWLQRWLTRARLRDAADFGIAAGVAVATKFSAVPFIGLATVPLWLSQWWLDGCVRVPGAQATTPGAGGGLVAGTRGADLHRWWSATDWRRLAGLGLAALTVLVPLILVYGPRAPNPPSDALRYHWALSYLLQRPGLDHHLGVLLQHLWLPRPLEDLVNGIVAVKAHNDTGHLSYLLGQVSNTGWWYFYLVALAVKTPLPLLVAGPVGLVLLARQGWRNGASWPLAPLVLVVTLLLFASLFSKINIGIRHILIVYPFLALGAAQVARCSWHAANRLSWRRVAVAAWMAVLLWQLSPLWRAWPDYLPYFNETVREPWHVLVDSDLDWGQDLRRLSLRAEQRRIPLLHLAYRGTAEPLREPYAAYRVLPPRTPVRGWVALSALARTRNPADYAWLDGYRAVERVGTTIDLYYIP